MTKLKEWVEGFFQSNYRDITARKTLEWGDAKQAPDGNWSIRYKYEATIWGKDKIVQDKIFTFTLEGGFVEVMDAIAATQPAVPLADASLPPLVRRDVNKKASEFSDKVDLSMPETAWAAWEKALSRRDAQAVCDLSWVKGDRI